jgi:hypothetical protein
MIEFLFLYMGIVTEVDCFGSFEWVDNFRGLPCKLGRNVISNRPNGCSKNTVAGKNGTFHEISAQLSQHF